VSTSTEPRQRALEALYAADRRQVDDPAADLTGKAKRFVDGVVKHRQELDEMLNAASKGWPVYRMPAVDRVVLRLGLYELVHEPDIPKAVVISEAVQLAKKYSTERSGAFVNGVLAALAESVR